MRGDQKKKEVCKTCTAHKNNIRLLGIVVSWQRYARWQTVQHHLSVKDEWLTGTAVQTGGSFLLYDF